MEKIDSLNQVAEFHRTFNAPILDTPQIPSEQRCQLRVDLLQEELDELAQALKDKDLVEVADALCDIQYVLSGAVLEFGLGDKFVELFNEVQRSNMSKACDTMQEALATLSHYKKKDGTEGNYKLVNGKYVVYRNADNKVLKSVSFPVSAVAAAVRGEAKMVLAPGPCLPSKFRFEVETQYSPFGILSSFIPKHAEHPGSRNSNPASVNILSKPSRSA